MYHFVQYQKKSGEITGYFRSSSREMLPSPSSPEEENIEVTDPEQVALLSALGPRAGLLKGSVGRGKVEVHVEPFFRGRIKLTSDLSDRDGDGLPELPADGEAVAHVQASLYDDDDQVVTASTPIRFKVSRGSVSRREVKTTKGVAEVEVRSVTETVRIRITASAEGFKPGVLDVETIPEEEHKALAGSRKKS